jgi:hypothetical protein
VEKWATPERELEPIAPYRLGADKRRWVEKSQESHWVGSSSLFL